jgi:hypothetical protein
MSDNQDFYELDQDTLDIFNEVYKKKYFSIELQFQFIGSSKQKELISIKKFSPIDSWASSAHIRVTINEDLIDVFDKESVSILIEQQLDRIQVDGESGKIKLVKPDLITFSGLIKKWGIEKVGKANKVEELYQQQKSDGQLLDS